MRIKVPRHNGTNYYFDEYTVPRDSVRNPQKKCEPGRDYQTFGFKYSCQEVDNKIEDVNDEEQEGEKAAEDELSAEQAEQEPEQATYRKTKKAEQTKYLTESSVDTPSEPKLIVSKTSESKLSGSKPSRWMFWK